MLSHIIKSIDFHFFKLKNLFEELQSYSYFTKDYRKLIKYLKKYLKEKYEEFIGISKSIRESVDNSDETYDSSNYKSLADFFLLFIEIFNFFIQNIRNSKNTQFHPANFILIKKFLVKDAKFLILPLSENSINYGYSNSLEVFQKANEKYNLNEFNDKIAIFDLFVIPHFNQKDIFMNSSLGHEIGHYREKKHNLYKQIEKEYTGRKNNWLGE